MTTLDSPKSFLLTVDYALTLEQMIASGHYDWKDSDIAPEHFPIRGEGVVKFEARYFQSGYNMSPETRMDWIAAEDLSNPWAPAQIEELLAHGAANPHEQRKYPIVAPGSVCRARGMRQLPYLDKHRSKRVLRLHFKNVGWSSICRFLAVRKVSVPRT